MNTDQTLHIVLVGNPVEGYLTYGPFKSRFEALFWAGTCREEDGEDWCVSQMLAPDYNFTEEEACKHPN